jgi:hypothetical protein
MIWRKDTRVSACVRVCARVGMCVCACACARGFVSLFFSRGCMRVGACAYACARVGAVGFKAAGTLARGHVRWICTIHHEHKGISCSPSRNPKGYPLPTSPRGILSPQPGCCLPLPWLACWLVASSLVISLLDYLVVG